MMDLRETQLALQRHVLQQDGAILAAIADTAMLPAQERLRIYTHAYVARLTEALQDSFPATSHVLGAGQFTELAANYVHAHPSHTASVRHYGRGLADFVSRRSDDERAAMLADLARWEWALGSAFDGPDAQPLGVADLAGVPPARWPSLRFRFAGSLQRVTLGTNAVEWWRFAVQYAAMPASAIRTATTEWVIWRTGLTTSFRSMAPDESRLLDDALRCRTFGALCAAMADGSDEAEDAALRAASLLRGWVEAGWVAGYDAGPAGDDESPAQEPN